MDSLYQRLKELDPDTFHRLCFHLLKERHPGADLHLVEGASGDEGLDVFQGELSGKPTIWQCKAFPNGVGKSQKSQIRHSFKTALSNFTPKNWVLCLSVNLDSKAYRWWEKYKQSHAGAVSIGEMFASQIVHELIHRRALRDRFFPGATIDPIQLKRLVMQTGELTSEEIENITHANLENYVERLKERDSRFNYEIVFSSDLGPPVPQAHRPGLMMSLHSGGKTVNVFARDVEALKADPPGFKLTFTGKGVDKYRALVKTGISQTFDVNEFKHVPVNLPFPTNFEDLSKSGVLVIGQTSSFANRRVKTRITFSKDVERVEYGLIELSPERVGTDEFELKSVSQTVPFDMRFELLWKTGGGKFTYTPNFNGADIRKIAKFSLALNIVQSGGTVEVYDLEHEARLFTLQTTPTGITEPELAFLAFVSKLALVAEAFDLEIKYPINPTDADFETISLLHTYVEGGTRQLDSFEFSLLKSEANKTFIETLSPTSTFRVENTMYEPKPILFGQEVNIGPNAITMPGAEIFDYEATLSRFRNADIGESVPFKLITKAPVKFELLPTSQAK